MIAIDERSKNIVAMRDGGAKWLEVGRVFLLTRERCRQLYARAKGVEKKRLLTPKQKLERLLARQTEAVIKTQGRLARLSGVEQIIPPSP
jgi:hypothetical protein